MNHGISILQGPHHVAQKFSRTTLPLKSESFTFLPVTSFSSKSGATFRSFSAVTAARTLVPVQPAKKAAQPSPKTGHGHQILIPNSIISGLLAMQETLFQTTRADAGETEAKA